MQFSLNILLCLASAGLLEAAVVPGLLPRQGSPTCLAQSSIQTASALTGQESGTEGIEEGQAPSLTDNANFINFCEGQQLTEGLQNENAACNPIPMGQIPGAGNMISSIIISPKIGQTFGKNESFNVQVQTAHLNAGHFTNPDTTYYSAPQQLDDNGDVIGHAHVTIQDIGSLNPTTPPDASTFAFFLGIDDDGNGQGLLTAPVTTGLFPGTYRVCTITSAANHQAANMPIAKRGAQEDCVRFNVADTSSGGGNGTTVRRH